MRSDREAEAYAAGRLAGYEDGLAAGEARLRAIEAAARERERAEEVYQDAETAYNESNRPEFTRIFLQLDRLANERAIAIAVLREALDGPA